MDQEGIINVTFARFLAGLWYPYAWLYESRQYGHLPASPYVIFRSFQTKLLYSEIEMLVYLVIPNFTDSSSLGLVLF